MDQLDLSVFQSQSYVRSKWSYTFECTFESFIASFVADSFLVVLLSYLGIQKAVIGVLSSMISLMFLVELLTIPLVRKISNTKKFAVILHLMGDLFFLGLYLIPFIPALQNCRTVAVVVCIVGGYVGNYLVTTMIFKWGNSFVDPHKRGDFSATKVMISLISGMAVTLSAGFVMEHFKTTENLAGWFIFATVALVVFTACDVSCLIIMKNNQNTGAPADNPAPMKEALKATLKSKYFVNTIIFEAIYKFGVYFTFGFIGVLKNQLFSLGVVQIINCVASTGYFLAAKPIGRFSDKHSFAKGIEIGIIAQALAFTAIIFTSDTTPWLLVVYAAFNGICNAGVGQNMLFLPYNFVDTKYFVQASALKSSIAGVSGFLASLIGSRVYTFISENNNTLFGIHAYPQQFMAVITVLIMLFSIGFDKLVIEKQNTMLQ